MGKSLSHLRTQADSDPISDLAQHFLYDTACWTRTVEVVCLVQQLQVLRLLYLQLEGCYLLRYLPAERQVSASNELTNEDALPWESYEHSSTTNLRAQQQDSMPNQATGWHNGDEKL